MLYAFPILIAAMLAYMFWHAGFRMRRTRIFRERSAKQLRAAPARIRQRR
jgi:hypothetical protein